MRPQRIIEVAAAVMGYSTAQILMPSWVPESRTRRLAAARQAVAVLLKERTTLSMGEVGKLLGRDRSTVHLALKLYREDRLKIEDGTLDRIRRILDREDSWAEFDREARRYA